jgi:hypothetical protein
MRKRGWKSANDAPSPTRWRCFGIKRAGDEEISVMLDLYLRVTNCWTNYNSSGTHNFFGFVFLKNDAESVLIRFVT